MEQSGEIWEYILGTDGRYSVSNIGNIRSNGFEVRNGNGVRRVRPRILKLQNHPQGYKVVNIKINDKYETLLVHRMVAMAFIPNPDNKEFINHIDGNKLNNCVDNLEWCTRQENENHAFMTGLKNTTGDNNGFAKKVIDVTTGKTFGTIKEASLYFGINYSTLRKMMCDIKNNTTNLRYYEPNK